MCGVLNDHVRVDWASVEANPVDTESAVPMAHDHYRSTPYRPAGSLRTYRIVSWCVGDRWYAEVHDQTPGGWMSLARYGPAPDRDAVERLARLEVMRTGNR